MVFNVPFGPRCLAFCGRVLRETAGRGNAAIVIWKLWLRFRRWGTGLRTPSL